MRAFLTTLIVLALAGGGVWWFVSKQQCKKAKAAEQAKERATAEQAVAAMCARYDAVSDWQDGLLADDAFAPLFTLHLQKALIRDDGRPIVAKAEITDVAKRDTAFIAHIVIELDITNQLNALLQCDSLLAYRLLREVQRRWSKYSVVVQITEVACPVFSVGAGVEEYEEGVYGEIVIDRSDVIIGRGRLWDFAPYPAP